MILIFEKNFEIKNRKKVEHENQTATILKIVYDFIDKIKRRIVFGLFATQI